jgi:hypothetical protein
VQLNRIAERTSYFILFLKQGFGIRLAYDGILACLYRRDGLLLTGSFWNIFTCDAELCVAETMAMSIPDLQYRADAQTCHFIQLLQPHNHTPMYFNWLF